MPWAIEWEGLDDAERLAARAAAALLALRAFWPKVVPVFIGWMREQFETEGRFGGSPWARLSPTYAAYKAVARPGRGILVFDGLLRGAASSPRRSVTATTMTLTISDPKAAFHQEGTTRMPARPILFGDPLPRAAAADIERIAEEYVEEILSRIR